jgi:hypothetical protein
VVKVVAAGERGSLLKAKTANSCYLCHWYIILSLLDLCADYGTGVSGVGKKTQCALLSKEFGFHDISLDDVLYEKSNDETYPHAEFVKDCLKENVVVPIGLAISLLEKKINEGIEDGKWILVRGFPESMQQLVEFEEKVGITYVDRILLISVGAKIKLYTTSETGTIFR